MRIRSGGSPGQSRLLNHPFSFRDFPPSRFRDESFPRGARSIRVTLQFRRG